jgi:hypothetical protein
VRLTPPPPGCFLAKKQFIYPTGLFRGVCPETGGKKYEREYMSIDKLRDKAALIAFQFLLEQSDYKKDKFIDTDMVLENAWELADKFIEKRGGPCRGCSLLKTSTDEIMKAAIAEGRITDQGAGPRKPAGVG